MRGGAWLDESALTLPKAITQVPGTGGKDGNAGL
jgi:hypothetical protein